MMTVWTKTGCLVAATIVFASITHDLTVPIFIVGLMGLFDRVLMLALIPQSGRLETA